MTSTTPAELLQEALKSPDKIEYLELISKEKNTKLKPEQIETISKFTNLKQLKLSGHGISYPPKFLQYFDKLENLDLSKNCLQQIPSNLTTNLVELNIRLNEFSQFPNLKQFVKLKKLDVSFNDIANIPVLPPNIANTLTSLDLSFNYLDSFPREVYKLHKLKELFLTKNNIKSVSGMSVFEETLEVLQLEETGLTEFPNDICDLFSLKELNLSNNKIPKLPSAVDRLHRLISLTNLNLSNCGLKDYSELYCQAKLRVLRLSSNKIVNAVPEQIKSLFFLEELYLNSNLITQIPENVKFLENLKILDISNNQIFSIDENIGSLERLEILKLSKNNLKTLPNSISQLKKLVLLDVSNNKLKNIPKIQSTQLRELLASNNCLEQIPEGLSNSKETLTNIDLTMNRLKQIPDEVYSLHKLKNLRLKHNAIEVLSCSIEKMTSLENLNLSHNIIMSIPEQITKLTNLSFLSLNYNHNKFEFSTSQQKWMQNVKVELAWDDVCKVMDGLFISSGDAAVNKRLLLRNNITHVLTVTGEIPPVHAGVFKYMIIHVEDNHDATLRPHFDETKQFIDEGRKAGGVLIHCMAGRSRSATIMTAYVMQSENMLLKDAFKLVRKARPQVYPNPKFRQELKKFEAFLHQGLQDPVGKKNRVEIYERN